MNDSQPELVTSLQPEHIAELRAARIALETPSFAMQAASVLGTPIEKGLAALPAGWQKTVRGAVQGALSSSEEFAATMGADWVSGVNQMGVPAFAAGTASRAAAMAVLRQGSCFMGCV